MQFRRRAAVVLPVAVALSVVAAPMPSASATATASVLVRFVPGANVVGAVRAVGAVDVRTLSDLDVHVLEVSASAQARVVSALSRRTDVRYAEPDGRMRATSTPNDTYWSQQWGAMKINAPAAWDTTTGAASTVVAVLDTGVTYSQADLGRFVPGYDFINGDSDPTDDNGHGTSTAGLVAATGNNSTGIAGMCWSCSIMPVKVLDSTAYGSWSAIAQGITWATDHGAKVISMSLGGTTGSSTLQSAVQYAQNHDVLVVAAAGNNASSALFYPAAYAGVLSVAGTQNTDALYSWSNYGSWVDVAAPGCDYATRMDGGYGSFCGTSAAAPMVAGAAALARTAVPAATAAQTAAAIEGSAVPIGSVVAYGRLDAAATLQALGSGSSWNPPPPPPASPATLTTTFSGSLSGKQTARTFAFSSGAGTASLSMTFTKTSSLTMALLNSSGATLAQTSGASPLKLTPTIAAGTYSIRVSGSSRATFTVTLICPSP
ncbi:MAG TPA: S8 family serine peptidase [Jatrophihabitantaceae bacterium]|nr:S8 family serine peptidase [Jatrophihabitantaceae bacterium]